MPQKRLRTAETAVRCDVGNAAAFCSADEFDLPNCSLLGQRRNSACRNARFWVSGRIRLAEMLAFRSAGEFGSPKCSLLSQRANSTCRNARFLPSGRIRFAELLAFRAAHGVQPVISARIQGIASLLRRWRTQENTSRSASRHSGQVA